MSLNIVIINVVVDDDDDDDSPLKRGDLQPLAMTIDSVEGRV